MGEPYLHVDKDLRPFYCDVYNALREGWLTGGFGPSQYELQLACRCSVLTVVKAQKELDQLIENSQKLAALEAAGVDNWEGYSYAMKSIK